MKKKLLATLLAVMLVLSLFPETAFAASTSDSCGANVKWSYNNGTLTIRGTGKMADYTPILLVDAPWFAYLEQIRTVDIGSGVTTIGNNAFSDCKNLTAVTIPDSVTAIGDGAFSGCESLASVSIPGRVTAIGDSAFSNCSSLADITVASGNSAYSSVDGVLFNADQTILHTYPAGKSSKSYNVPASVTAIGDSAFWNCEHLTNMNIPNSVKAIGDFAFAWCAGLTNITIPNGVTAIEPWVFLRCSSLTGVSIPNSVTSIGEFAFSYCESLANVTIPNSVTTIGEKAFHGCTSLTSVTIPSSVKSFGESAFQECSNLTSVTIPNGVASIPMGLFSLCSSLTSITIPSSVTAIGSMAFNRCDSLKNVYYGGSESQWKQIAISSTNKSLTNATIHYNSAMPTTPTEPTTPTFTDVPAGEWYADPVAWAVEKNITNGTSSATFSPSQNCTQAQILTFLYRADRGEGAATAEDMGKAISWAREKGMIDSSFDRNKPCTRSTAVSYIWQAFNKPTAKASSFTDVPTSAAYAKAVDWAVEKGITKGDGSEDTFAPDKVCTRGHIATFLYRAYNN